MDVFGKSKCLYSLAVYPEEVDAGEKSDNDDIPHNKKDDPKVKKIHYPVTRQLMKKDKDNKDDEYPRYLRESLMFA